MEIQARSHLPESRNVREETPPWGASFLPLLFILSPPPFPLAEFDPPSLNLLAVSRLSKFLFSLGTKLVQIQSLLPRKRSSEGERPTPRRDRNAHGRDGPAWRPAHLTVMFRPFADPRSFQVPEWRNRCQMLYTELRSYLMVRLGVALSDSFGIQPQSRRSGRGSSRFAAVVVDVTDVHNAAGLTIANSKLSAHLATRVAERLVSDFTLARPM